MTAPLVPHDSRGELLVVLGILSIAGGLALTLFIVLLGRSHRDPPNVGGAFVLCAVAVGLIVGGNWLVRGRRWAGMLVAAISLCVASVYLVTILTQCRDCTPGVLAANIAIAILFALPGAAIVRWRRVLR